MTAARPVAVRLLWACVLLAGLAAAPAAGQAPAVTAPVAGQAPSAATATEPAPRHNQRRLLEQAIAGLAPRDAGRINMYLLAVAGDGSQEVFRREVQFVHNQFADRFAMRGYALTLVNSRSTLGSVPMATRASLREALRAIAARMDTQEDVLFLFLTSHGSPRHEFALHQPRMGLRDLTARELRSLLKDSGIRWKVVVISACYSGGFIDAIKDDTTLVITAARHDRPSFGCTDEADFTYFGRAYFKESLPRAHSFEDAFAGAAALVREWEKKDAKAEGKPGEDIHSYPQMHSPEPIVRHLRRWWRQHATIAQHTD